MVPSWIIVQNGAEVGVLVHPRYVLPLQVLLMGLTALRRRPILVLGLSRVQRWINRLGLAGANATALYTTLRRYLTGTDYAGLT